MRLTNSQAYPDRLCRQGLPSAAGVESRFIKHSVALVVHETDSGVRRGPRQGRDNPLQRPGDPETGTAVPPSRRHPVDPEMLDTERRSCTDRSLHNYRAADGRPESFARAVSTLLSAGISRQS